MWSPFLFIMAPISPLKKTLEEEIKEIKELLQKILQEQKRIQEKSLPSKKRHTVKASFKNILGHRKCI